MMSRNFTSLYGSTRPASDPCGEYASLSTITWSPVIKVLSMDPEGITKGCAMVLVAKSSTVMLKTQSASVERLVLK